MKKKTAKSRKCRVCGSKYTPHTSFQKWCSPDCGVELSREAQRKAREAERKAERRDLKKRKEKLKSRSEWLREAQRHFNRYIRLRDKGQPCISCGSSNVDNHLTGGLWDCGHYRSIGANPELRFEELNCAKQCKKCNRDLSGNVTNYRIELEKRIGKEKLEWLEGPHEPKKYTIDEIKQIIKTYREKCRELEKS